MLALTTAADHISFTHDSLQKLPKAYRSGLHTQIGTDSAGGTHAFLDWLTHQNRQQAFRVGFTFTQAMTQAALHVQKPADWGPTIDSTHHDQDSAAHHQEVDGDLSEHADGDRKHRDHAWVADITDHLDVSSCQQGCGSSCVGTSTPRRPITNR
ncbi:MAG: hypothetical protein HLX51_14120 [Micrococcaceae bacterium]|nr:hypothetical protein [Micrococcaceae bacterium]